MDAVKVDGFFFSDPRIDQLVLATQMGRYEILGRIMSLIWYCKYHRKTNMPDLEINMACGCNQASDFHAWLEECGYSVKEEDGTYTFLGFAPGYAVIESELTPDVR